MSFYNNSGYRNVRRANDKEILGTITVPKLNLSHTNSHQAWEAIGVQVSKM